MAEEMFDGETMGDVYRARKEFFQGQKDYIRELNTDLAIRLARAMGLTLRLPTDGVIRFMSANVPIADFYPGTNGWRFAPFKGKARRGPFSRFEQQMRQHLFEKQK